MFAVAIVLPILLPKPFPELVYVFTSFQPIRLLSWEIKVLGRAQSWKHWVECLYQEEVDWPPGKLRCLCVGFLHFDQDGVILLIFSLSLGPYLVVNRCPLRLIMKKAKANEEWSAKVSTTVNPRTISVPTPATLTATIERLTTSLTRSSVGFSTESIIVELVGSVGRSISPLCLLSLSLSCVSYVYRCIQVSPDAPDLTLIDLPGIVRTSTQGQVRKDNKRIRGLLNKTLFSPPVFPIIYIHRMLPSLVKSIPWLTNTYLKSGPSYWRSFLPIKTLLLLTSWNEHSG